MKVNQLKKLNDVLGYLESWDRMKRRPIFQLSEHRDFLLYEHETFGLANIHFDVSGEDTPIWLEVPRLQATEPPQPDDWLRPWLIVYNDPNKAPQLRESLTLILKDIDESFLKRIQKVAEADEEGRVNVTATSVEGLQPAVLAYIDQAWQAWARKEVPRRRTIDLYQRLFRLLKRIEDEGAESPTEVAWGIGQAIWRCNRQLVQYPLLIKRVELELDSKTMEIRVRPTERDPRIELDRYAQLQVENTSTVERFARSQFELAEDEFSPFQPETFTGILQYAAANLCERGVYMPHQSENPSDRMPPPAKEHLQVTDTWVLFARVRPTDVLAEDVRRLRQQLAQLDEHAELPVAAEALLEGPPDEIRHFERINFRGFAGHADSSGFVSRGGENEAPTQELFFPLPYNKEQVAIVERLEQSRGVTVEGPPGTGKSHTIANIICHSLAKGERVLVTSYGEPALAVLRDKIPQALQPLVISLLTSEREGLQQLRQSVENIAGRITQINERDLLEEIKDTDAKIDRLHQTIARLDTELREWADAQFSETSIVPGLLPLELAKWVIEHEAAYNLIPDKLSSDERFTPRFSEEDLERLRYARRRLCHDLRYCGKPLPALEDLPTADTLVRIHASLQQQADVQGRIANRNLPRIDTAVHDTAIALFDRLEALEPLLDSVQGLWLDRLRRLFSGESTDAAVEDLQGALIEWLEAVDRYSDGQREVAGHAITLPDDADRNTQLRETIERAAMGKRAFGLLDFKKGAYTDFKAIELDGHRPTEPQQWQVILQRLNLLAEARRLTSRWNAMAEVLQAPLIEEGSPARVHGALLDRTKKIKDAHRIGHDFAPLVTEEAHVVFAGQIDGASLLWDRTVLTRAREGLQAYLQEASLNWAQRQRRELAELLRAYDVEPTQALYQLVAKRLGAETIENEQVAEEWSTRLTELKRIHGLSEDLQTVKEVTDLIHKSGAPQYAQHLRTEPADGESDPTLPVHFFEAWKWARAAGHIDEIDGRSRIRVLNKKRAEAEQALAVSHARAVELRTWLNLKRRISPKVSTALNDYLSAIKKIGKGTGKRAAIHRRTARDALQKSYNAVPCWIMSQHRVSEALPSELASFDLVIIDEASQSDAWALLALLRGKRVLIVGDDNQVSPEAVGMPTEVMQRLQHEHLKGLEYGHLLLPDRSIYDFGFTLFAADKLRLTEHFRCVEPIIAYSSRNFYNNEIRPLRIPKASERLDPPLIDVHVSHGYRAPNRKINTPEAQAIVDEIARIVERPSMSGRTIGVVTLLGSEQAHLIRDMVAQQIGEEAIQRHDIRFGDARTFQGKEADIVMISLVDDVKHLRSVTQDSYRQRYNVAASRARDRMYVFHSFRREDCKEADLRAGLLDHLRNPLRQDTERIEDLRLLCESSFELDFYDEMTRRGYRVTPQVRVGQYRIDFVIEGSEDRRLAIELDGDQYHVNRWLEDTQRQRILERLGWVFWRCWGSSYYRDKEGCLNELREILQQHGIEPIGSAETAVTRLTEFWVLDELGGRSIYSANGELISTEEGAKQLVDTPALEPVCKNHDDQENSADGDDFVITINATNDVITQPPIQQRSQYRKRQPMKTSDEQTGLFATEDDLVVQLRTQSVQEALPKVVDVGDIVRYVDLADPENLRSVQIAYGHSDSRSGVINPATPLAQALLEGCEGDEVVVELPAGTRSFKILEVLKGSGRDD